MCKCHNTADKPLKELGVSIDWAFMIDPKNGAMRVRARIPVRKLDPKSRKSLPIVAATYCPFCGERYDKAP